MARNTDRYFSVSYETLPGQLTEQKFFTKKQNDEFAAGMELMGVKNIIKTHYDPLARKWFSYTDKWPENDSNINQEKTP